MSVLHLPRDHDLEAVIGALATENGGRRSAMMSGYRPTHDLGIPGEFNDAMHEYPDTGQIAPGDTARALLWLLAPERQAGRLFTGMLFTVQEGAQVVGNGRIVRVMSAALERARPIHLEIDGSRIGSLEEFYREVSRTLIPGVSWGHNLDAFNDILRGGFGTPDGGFKLIWRHHGVSREHLGYPETVRQLELRLARCHPSNRPGVAADLARARSTEGASVFDWVVEIIRDHGAGGEQASDGVDLVLN